MKNRLTKAYVAAQSRYTQLNQKAAAEEGLETAEKIFLTVGAVILAAGAIAAITAFVNGQIALLPSN
jgi:butyrate kinase